MSIRCIIKYGAVEKKLLYNERVIDAWCIMAKSIISAAEGVIAAAAGCGPSSIQHSLSKIIYALSRLLSSPCIRSIGHQLITCAAAISLRPASQQTWLIMFCSDSPLIIFKTDTSSFWAMSWAGSVTARLHPKLKICARQRTRAYLQPEIPLHW